MKENAFLVAFSDCDRLEDTDIDLTIHKFY